MSVLVCKPRRGYGIVHEVVVVKIEWYSNGNR